MENSMSIVSGFSLLWCTLYFGLCHWKPHKSNEWHCRTVTAVHAVVVCFLCIWCAFVQGPWPFTEAGLPMLFHHVCSIMGMTIGTVTGRYGTEMIATIFGSEITNPLLQIRWFLRETGNYETVLGEVVDHSFMFLFGFFRIGIGSYLLLRYFQQDTDFLGRFGAVVIYAISWMFWINIMVYAGKKYKKRFQTFQQNNFKRNNDSVYNNGILLNGGVFYSNAQNRCDTSGLSNGNSSKVHAKQCNGRSKTS
ncbi:TLC domain-containing protein 5-like isoform X2 [Saccostrea echinata]|uniref:TLC domain-containing protein 5-like isoform X2 n=1 Tax=Saccostrea echinata TaxID=191078 RepID=UPI002A81E73D|nr:TLC domain-containing protein 5-like isoform X2 [Saccostrea echinata]